MANQNHSKILQLLEKKQLNLSNKNGGDEVEQWREEHGEVQDSSSDLPQRLKAAEEACRVAQVHDDDMKRPKVIVCKTQESEWTAIVQFNDEQDAKFLITLASKSNGIPLLIAQLRYCIFHCLMQESVLIWCVKGLEL
jgi:hypothetical protein